MHALSLPEAQDSACNHGQPRRHRRRPPPGRTQGDGVRAPRTLFPPSCWHRIVPPIAVRGPVSSPKECHRGLVRSALDVIRAKRFEDGKEATGTVMDPVGEGSMQTMERRGVVRCLRLPCCHASPTVLPLRLIASRCISAGKAWLCVGGRAGPDLPRRGRAREGPLRPHPPGPPSPPVFCDVSKPLYDLTPCPPPPTCGPRVANRVCCLWPQPGCENNGVIVQDFVANNLEARCFVVRGQVVHVVYSNFKRTDDEGYLCEFEMMNRQQAIGQWLDGDEKAMAAAERKITKLIGQWLVWCRCRDVDEPPCIRMDFLINKPNPGQADVHTLELTELGFSMLAWDEGPAHVFSALIDSCFEDIGPSEAEARRLAKYRSLVQSGFSKSGF